MIEGIQGYQNIPRAEVPRDEVGIPGYQSGYSIEQRQKVQQEFMAIFYKELLKQAFKPPNLTGTNNPNSIGNTFSTDMFVEQMAKELAQSKSFSANELFPGAIERKLVTE